MDPQTFLDNFATIANAPGGVQRLRDLVLALAVRGQLVDQDPSDEPAGILLDGMSARRDALIASGQIGKPRHPERVAVDDPPHEIPATWAWARLGDVGAVVGGGTPKSGEPAYWADGTDVAWLTPADMRSQASRLISRGARDITARGLAESSAQLLPAGSVLFSSRAPIGHVGIAAQPLATNQGFKSCVPYVGQMTEYLYLFLRYVGPIVDASATGTTFKEVSGKQVALIPVPVPPLAEQERIVAKVDELTGLCDDLEAHQERRHRATTRFRGSALHALTDAETPHDLRTAWERASASWPVLTSDPESIPELRRSILSLAVSGRLASQDPGDLPAAELLDEIATRQVELKGERGLHGVRLPVAQPTLPAPRLPEGWAWARLGALLRHCRNGIATRPNEAGIGYPLLRISAGTSDPNGWVNLEDHKFAELEAEDVAPYVLDPGDLVACRFNGNLHYVGRAAIVPEHVGDYLHPDKLIRLKAISADHRYLMFAMNSRLVRAQIEDVAATTAGNIGINGAQLQALHVPVPPYREQTRIADRVEQLFRLCTDLEVSFPRQIVSAEKLATGLASHIATPHRAPATAIG